MCGIVGFTGKRNALPILLEGLEKLEYRGYDSAGVSFIDGKSISVIKNEGRIEALKKKIPSEKSSFTGIGHTRWATHGIPSFINAHPHYDCTHQIVLVHNGIIENYRELKDKLIKKGHVFLSDTDTEVIAHLIEDYYEEDIEFAVKAALNDVDGAYAIGVLCINEPNKIIAARKGSPLILGIGEGENFLASDIPAVLKYTKKIIFLEENEIAVLTPEKIKITTFKNTIIDRKPIEISWDETMAAKDGYDHFMMKEIMEQPSALQKTFQSYVVGDKIKFDDFRMEDEKLRSIEKIFIVACGTSYHAALVGKYWIERFARISVEVDFASEFRYRDPILNENNIAIFISQSGETADTLAGLRICKEKTSNILGIVNVVGSTISREASDIIYTHAGPEIGVASTKAFTTQLLVLYLFSIYIAEKREKLDKESIKRLLAEARRLPQILETALMQKDNIKHITEEFRNFRDYMFIGRNLNFPIALEGALKLKEISYLHAEAYPAGEMKHGPIALIDNKMPTMVLLTPSKVLDKTISNIQEIKARKGIVAGVIREGDEKAERVLDYSFAIPDVGEVLSPIINVIPLQLFAYYIASQLNCDIDKPRNLAKSVTVE